MSQQGWLGNAARKAAIDRLIAAHRDEFEGYRREERRARGLSDIPSTDTRHLTLAELREQGLIR